MKTIHTVMPAALLAVTNISFADFPPEEWFANDTLAVLVVTNPTGIRDSMHEIARAANAPVQGASPIKAFVRTFVPDTDAVDLDSPMVLVLQPAKVNPLSPGGGMFGPQPEMVFFCHLAEGQTEAPSISGGLKAAIVEDGWLIASSGKAWSPPSEDNSGGPWLIDDAPLGDFVFVADFGTLWKQLGPMAQMMGGAMIMSMNQVPPGSVPDKRSKRKSAAASKAFRQSMKALGQVDTIVATGDFDGYDFVIDLDITTTNATEVSPDNDAIERMSRMLPAGQGASLAMSKRMLELYASIDFEALAELANSESAPFMTQDMAAEMIKLTRGGVVATYNLGPEGFDAVSLADVSDSKAYAAAIPGFTKEFIEYMGQSGVEAKPVDGEANTWSIDVVGDGPNHEVFSALFGSDSQIKFTSPEESIEAFSIGSADWNPIGKLNDNLLTQLLEEHGEESIDLALTVDPRQFMAAFLDIAEKTGHGSGSIATSPSARSSLVLGRSTGHQRATLRVNVMGLARLGMDMEQLNSGAVATGGDKLAPSPSGD